jgi:hypothetical protein
MGLVNKLCYSPSTRSFSVCYVSEHSGYKHLKLSHKATPTWIHNRLLGCDLAHQQLEAGVRVCHVAEGGLLARKGRKPLRLTFAAREGVEEGVDNEKTLPSRVRSEGGGGVGVGGEKGRKPLCLAFAAKEGVG